MSNDGFKLKGTIEWKVFDKNGNLRDKGKTTNQIQNELFTEAIDAFNSGTFDNPVVAMAVGEGTGQNVADTTLSSITSDVGTADGLALSQPSAAQLQAVGNFTTWTCGSVTLTEACLSGDSAASDHMYCYDDSISISIGSASDTLQITWTVDASV